MGALLSPAAAAWRRMTGALWFLPAVLLAATVVLAVVLVDLDPKITRLEELSPRFFTVSPQGARGVLTAIATAMLSVAGLVFTITIAALSFTSQNFTSRVLRTFINDRGNQLVLGVFLGAFAYSLIVLRSVRDPGTDEGFVPEVALLVAIGLALLGAALLIYFINHVAGSLQASTIIARISRQAVAELHAEEQRKRQSSRDREGWLRAPVTCPVRSRRNGYVRTIDLATVGRLAERRDFRVRVETQTGSFVIEGQPLLALVEEDGRDHDQAEEVAATLRKTITIEASRDIKKDPAFGVRQLVDIALRALSPGVNDTTTAVICVDYLTPILVAANEYATSDRVWRGEDETEWAFSRNPGFEDLLDQAFSQITVSGAGNLAILTRQIMSLELLEERVDDPERRALLARRLSGLVERGETNLPSPVERLQLTGIAAALTRALNQDQTLPA